LYNEKMKITTRDFGEIEVQENDIINFICGMYGFKDKKSYVLLKDNPDDDIMFLQSLDDVELSFVLIDPYSIFRNYNPDLNEEDLEELGVGDGIELKFLTIAIIKEDIRDSVVNLKSPIAINPATRTAKQVILQNTYPLRYEIMVAEEGEKC